MFLVFCSGGDNLAGPNEMQQYGGRFKNGEKLGHNWADLLPKTRLWTTTMGVEYHLSLHRTVNLTNHSRKRYREELVHIQTFPFPYIDVHLPLHNHKLFTGLVYK